LIITFTWGWWLQRWITQKEWWALLIVALLAVFGGWFTWKAASLTGALLFPVVSLVAIARIPRMRSWVTAAAFVGVGLLLALVWSLRPVYPEHNALEATTPRGESYVHYPDRCLRENGHHVWTHIAWDELYHAWSERSDLAFSGVDGRNQELKMTLIRFLASRGVPKDADGLATLTDQEIRWIESGIPTAAEIEHRGLRRRLDVIQFEVWNALDGGNPSGHSLVQRLAFLDAARHIYQHHPVVGVGIGDLPNAYARAYADLDSPLDDAFRLRAHNQYVTFLVAGGPLNLILWLVLLGTLIPLQPLGNEHPTAQAVLFLVVIALSCLTEDTLETQAGVTFTGFFIGLLGRRSAPHS
jgi:hypothetical protein